MHTNGDEFNTTLDRLRASTEKMGQGLLGEWSSPEYLIPQVLPRKGAGSFRINSHMGELFFAHLIVTVAGGGWWNREKVEAAKVTYVSSGRTSSFHQAVIAQSLVAGLKVKDLSLTVISDMPRFLEGGAGALGAAVNADGGSDLIVIDGVDDAMAGGNPTSLSDMKRFLAAVRLLQRDTGAFVLLTHKIGYRHDLFEKELQAILDVKDPDQQEYRNAHRFSAMIPAQNDYYDGVDLESHKVIVGHERFGVPVLSTVVLPKFTY